MIEATLAVLLALGAWRIHQLTVALRSVERERDEWMRKAERYFESADRGSMGEQTSQWSAGAFSPEDMQQMAERQRQMLNTCPHGLSRCPVCR